MIWIKDLFSIEPPKKPKNWQAYLFCLVMGGFLSYYFWRSNFTTEIYILSILPILVASIKIEYIKSLMFSILYVLFLLIHAFALLSLSLCYFLIFTPSGILIKIFKSHPMQPAWNKQDSYFIESKKIEKDHFTRPY